MAIVKTKKNSHGGSNQIENVKEQAYDMELEGLNPPAPDSYPGQSFPNQGSQAPNNNNFGEIALNEQALEELIEKEEENLTKKENSQMKSLEEIKNNLNSMSSFFNNNNDYNKISLYEEEFYSNLKKQISK